MKTTLSNFSLIVPVRNRHYNIKRICDYYSDLDCKKIIVDTSDTKYPDVDYVKSSGFEYVYWGSTPYIETMKRTYNELVDTQFVLDCSDDDIILKDSIYKCVDFLKENEDYVSCDGEYIWYHQDLKKLEVRHPNKFFGPLKENFHSPYPKDRVEFEFNCCMSRQHCVLRSSVPQKFWNHISNIKILHPMAFIERFHVFVTSVLGNSKKLPILYQIRSAINDHVYNQESIKEEIDMDLSFVDNLDEDHLKPFTEFLCENQEDLSYDATLGFVHDLIKNQLNSSADACSTDTSGWNFRAEWERERSKYAEEINLICGLMADDYDG